MASLMNCTTPTALTLAQRDNRDEESDASLPYICSVKRLPLKPVFRDETTIEDDMSDVIFTYKPDELETISTHTTFYFCLN